MDRLALLRLGTSSGPRSAASGCEGRQFNYTLPVLRRSLSLELTIDHRTAADLRRVGRLRRHPRTLLAVAACIIIFLVWQRCPTVISRAAFWAEDGWVWYPQCYASGWRCLLIDHSAYLQTISRLVALLSLLWPLAAAPRVFALSALLMQSAPAIFLLSRRMASAIPSVGVRVALALLLVAIPGMSEIYVNLTNSQWHLSLLAFLILCANPAQTGPERIFDTLVLAVGGLSGPFAPPLVPVALLWWWRDRRPWLLWRLVIMIATAAIQIGLVLVHQSTRGIASPGIGWSLVRLINIVVTDILGVAAFGRTPLIDHNWLVGQGWLSDGSLRATIMAGCLMAGAMVLALLAFVRGPWVLRAFLIFTTLELTLSLTDGLTLVQPLWVAMEGWIGMRYYFHPIAAWLAIIVTLICDRNASLRTIGVAIMALTLVYAIPGDWHLPKRKVTIFQAQANAFAHAPPGTMMRFPVAPARDMVLVKH